ncbi:PPC domain-containing protein [Pararhizobium sp.]|uniref:PPC domain-containing protein n=1 Tax=Pararhizobium sp. TaxID=1977563 RepID=UPI0027262B6D|nr:PPC domain-containing protein [Pararhizobium sp.]MDO9415555.1 PPC domain-containing protein [Pararhizobium sp.]
MLNLLIRIIRLLSAARSPVDLAVRAVGVATIIVVVTVWGIKYNRSQAAKNSPPVVSDEGSILSGTPKAGTLLPGQQMAWEFAGSKGQHIAVAVVGNWDSVLELYRPGGIRLLTRDDNSGADGQALIDGVTLPDDGVYRIVVSGRKGEAGVFKLFITDSEKRPQPAILQKVGN